MSRYGLRHACGGEMRVMLTPTEDGENTATFAYCSNCMDRLLIHTGAWEDERFQAALEALMANANA